MSSVLPSPNDDYAAAADLQLSREVWDAVMGSIGARLRAAEAIRADFDALIALGTGQALQVISANVAPQLEAVAAQLDALEADAAAAQDLVAQIAAGSIPASAVTETVARIWLTPTLKATWDAKVSAAAMDSAITTAINAAVASLMGGATPATLDTLDELAQALGDDPNFATTMATALGNRLRVDSAQGLTAGQQTQARGNIGLGALAVLNALTASSQIGDGLVTIAKLAAAALASNADAVAGLATDKLMTPQRTKEAIQALAPTGTSSLAATGWERRPNGVIEQWGRYTDSTAINPRTVILPTSFPTGCYWVDFQLAAGSSVTNGIIPGTLGTSSFQANRLQSDGQPSSDNFYWRALGV